MGGLIASAFIGVISSVFGFLTNIAATITGTFLGMAVAVFNWVASDNFISLSYTQPGPVSEGGNPFIEIGWTLTRDLTNIFFVLALVVIGLATALRWNDYQAKKALPTLIIIALLINFTPVICGLIVDATNIVMNFFIQGGFASGSTFANFAVGHWENVSSLVGGIKFWDPIASQEAIAAAAGSLILVFFNLVASLIYLLFAFLFIFRYIAIWTLVILSPIAFASYIFPATRKTFSSWWNHFIQWSMVGVIASFFLYLGDHFVREAIKPEFLEHAMAGMEDAPGLSMVINNMMPYGIAISFLAIGLVMALNTSAVGAQQIISFGKKAGGFMAKSGANLTAGRWMAREAAKGDDSWLKKVEQANFGLKWKGASLGRKALTAAMAPALWPMRWATRKGIRAGLDYGFQQPAAMDALVGKYEKEWAADPDRAHLHYNQLRPTQWLEKNAHFLAAAKAKGGKGLSKFTNGEMMERIGSLSKYNPGAIEDVIGHMPELVDDKLAKKRFGKTDGPRIAGMLQGALIKDGLKKDRFTGYYKDSDVQKMAEAGVRKKDLLKTAAFKKAIDKMKTSHLETADIKLGENKTFVKLVAQWKNDRGFLQKSFDKFGANFVAEVQNEAESLDPSAFVRNNPALLRLQQSPFGRELMRQWKVGGQTIKNKGQMENLIARYRGTASPELEKLRNMMPEPTAKEKERYADMAEQKRSVPPLEASANVLRDVRGAINALTYRIDSSHKQIEGSQRQMQKLTLDMQRANAQNNQELRQSLQMELDEIKNNQNNMRIEKEQYEGRRDAFANREEAIAGKLAAEKARKQQKRS